ncbi:MAG: hypothetical protein C4326_03095 [Ignavibacteria bacterium]
MDETLQVLLFDPGVENQAVRRCRLQPLFCHWRSVRLHPVRPYAFVGPNLGPVLSSKQKVQGFAGIQDGEYDIKSSTSSLDFGLEFGGGAELKVAKHIALTGDVRYNLGLSNLNDSPTQQGGQSLNLKSRSFVILFGVLFLI